MVVHDAAEDRRLTALAKAGDADALEALVERHHVWVFHLAQRMLWNRQDAEDATQEILIKAVTALPAFEGRSEFRTWLYRIAGNHLLDRCRAAKSFDAVAQTLSEIPDRDLPDPNSSRLEISVLVEEAKLACTVGILLCLEPRQRMAFLLGEVLGVNDDVGGEILNTSPANFRQLLSRARRALYGFLQRQCGLADQANACRCRNKALGFIALKIVDPERLPFSSGKIAEVQKVAADRLVEIHEVERGIFREQPLASPPDQAARLRTLFEQTGIQKSLGLS
jgi:RNA polymerase sigma factor (sigma-70 family)